MKFGNFSTITPAKILSLKNRITELEIDLEKIEEKFSTGGGKGGQKINKTSNKVILKYPPLNIVISCQRERSRAINRFLALRKLVDLIEQKLTPQTSALTAKINKIRKQKSRKKSKGRKKYTK